MISKFEIYNFEEFMFTIQDFTDSLTMWKKENSNNTWDMELEIAEDKYIINIIINEGKDKSEQYI